LNEFAAHGNMQQL